MPTLASSQAARSWRCRRAGVAPWTDVLAAWTERMERASVVPSPSAARLRATLGALLHGMFAWRSATGSSPSGEAQGEQETGAAGAPGSVCAELCVLQQAVGLLEAMIAEHLSSSKGTGGHDEDGALDGTEGAEEGGEGEDADDGGRTATVSFATLDAFALLSCVWSSGGLWGARDDIEQAEARRDEALRSALSSDVLARQLAQLGQPGSSDPPPQSVPLSSVWWQAADGSTSDSSPFLPTLPSEEGAAPAHGALEECARTALELAPPPPLDLTNPPVELFVLDGCAFGLQEVVRLSLSSERPLLLSGPAGCGKTAMLTHALRRLSAMAKEDSAGAASNTGSTGSETAVARVALDRFLSGSKDGQSTSTSAEALADSITASLAEANHRHGRGNSQLAGRTALLIDDLHLAQLTYNVPHGASSNLNQVGHVCRPSLELLRLWLDHGGWHRRGSAALHAAPPATHLARPSAADPRLSRLVSLDTRLATRPSPCHPRGRLRPSSPRSSAER